MYIHVCMCETHLYIYSCYAYVQNIHKWWIYIYIYIYANLLMLGTKIPYDLNVHLPGAVVGSPGALGEGGG